MTRAFILCESTVSRAELGVYQRILEGAQWKVAPGRDYQTADVTAELPGVKRAFFVKLPPGGWMHWHVDAGDCRTDHIVMSSNDLCENAWQADDGSEHATRMLEGHRYSVNRTIPHAAFNRGATDRVHLLVEF